MFIDTLINISKDRSVLSKEIDNLYYEYINSGNDRIYNEMIVRIDSYCIIWCKAELKKNGCYSVETEEEALQESRIAVWETVNKDYRNKNFRNNFSYYAFNIYKHKTIDEIRKIIKRKKRFGEKSIDEPIGDGEVLFIDTLSTETLEDSELRKEERTVFSKLFYVYCQSFTESKTFPPRLLALYYARVLPHLTHSIPDTKGTSAKWAQKKMGLMRIVELKSDSESSMSLLIDNRLKWNDEFITQLNDELEFEGRFIKLADIVYTKAYDKGKIEDWADYMHKAIVKASMKRILQDAQLLALVKSHISNTDILYRFVDGGRNK